MRTFGTVLFLFLIMVSSRGQSYKDTIFTDYFQRNQSGWNAGDGTISVLLPDGRTLWMFGDSHVDQDVAPNNTLPCLFNTRNSIMVQDAEDPTKFDTYYDAQGTDAYERQFVKMPGDDRATYWPADGFVHGDTAYLFWTRFAYDTSAVWNLDRTGMVIAKVKLPEIDLAEVVPVLYPEIQYGMAVVKDEQQGFYYLFGKIKDWIVYKPVLARCTLDNITGPWEFYSGHGNWKDHPRDSVTIAPEVTAEYSVFELHGVYYMFYQKTGFLQCGLGREMYMYRSPVPEGPFENRVLVYTMEDTFMDTFPITYNGQAHPQFIENDELLISYNLNKVCPNPCQDQPFTSRFNADTYRPQFARVPLSLFATTHAGEKYLQSVSVFPVPSTGVFTLKGHQQGETEYIIMDLNGQIILRGTGSRINLSNYPNGVYFLQLRHPDNTSYKRTLKLVKL